ncbi:hypothetical protein BCR34DRAFT_600974 [Clohesyomyces aquaticus]|uniref:Protein kinase domain-containing protein n=1 Tax=Clohesyomyces aquaticus TaxID=1231657 RepID=A0A1Y1ZP65_9PLEO|nr:hypothetical protein BCR34DRAFT_600974 [Clohesyomyces aquaticus]
MSDFEWVKSFTTSSYGTVNSVPSVASYESPSVPASTSRGSFASFVCHVVNLERKLRSFSPIVLDNSSNVRVSGGIVGQGKSFLVRRAQWLRNPNEPPLEVALKEIIPNTQASDGISSSSPSSSHRAQNDWKEILFEIRALLHEPVRYHPNLVRLLGIQWGLSPISESTYPVLIVEYASLGTFMALQASSKPLSFQLKQKLCYDVGRGLSALHSSGVVHGDMKHENVLIFPSKTAFNGIQYTAKLADFGGTVMDMTHDELRILETFTWPFEAPEVGRKQFLSREGMMLTDVYSFGLLVWRAFVDGQGFVSLSGAAPNASDQEKVSLKARKATEDFTKEAIMSIYEYGTKVGISQTCIDIITYTILHTVRLAPKDRNLTKAQAALRGLNLEHISGYLNYIREENAEWDATEARAAPGRHGITRDSLAFYLGRSGEDADLQDNMPGFRPRLERPSHEEYFFDPESLKTTLTWEQQQQMLVELKDAASDRNHSSGGLLEMKKTVAAFYVFQSYVLEFGTVFDATAAVQWLSKAASDDDSHEDADYFAQAWIWRIARALGVNLSLDMNRVRTFLQLSVVRGHRSCLQEILDLANENNGSKREDWLKSFRVYRRLLLEQMGAVGMGYFFPKFMTGPWETTDMNNIAQLDESVRTILGDKYTSCLKSSAAQLPNRSTPQRQDKEATAFDRIYVNGRGHGPLHYAAATGALKALGHIISKYECDVNLPNQHVDEPPLVCACSGGQRDCVLLLLEHGADPNGYRYGQEGPLHWLCSFLPDDMDLIASRLIAAGADIELRSGGMRQDVRGIRADWEHIFEIRTTPLGRAVLMNNIDAVRVLLKLGANPLNKSANKHPGEWDGLDSLSKFIDVSSPFELAAVLTLPEILAEFIQNVDGSGGASKLKLLDESTMLDLAHEKKVTEFDPLSLQSRLVRCGVNYKRNMRSTLTLLYARALAFHGGGNYVGDEVQKNRSRVLYKEVALGNIDIVECLLQLGYSANGTEYFRPLEKVVELNHEPMFNLLMRFRADAQVTRLTPTGHISLLHICASRQRHSRPGTAIAHALIAAGVPVENRDPRSRPPLATAIVNRNFDVARALLEAGANVNATYPLQFNGTNGMETKIVSVLVEVLSQHTMRTIESLKFLFGKCEGGPTERPAFYIDPANQFSILHLLAGGSQFTQIAQITPRILDLCLDTYSDADLINYRHPLLGTALYYAATNGHKAMVERLLRRGADYTSHAGPDIIDSAHTFLRPKETWTPLWAAILRFDDQLKKGEVFPPDGPPGAWLKSDLIQNAEKTIELLSEKSTDALAAQAITKLQGRKMYLEAKFRELQKVKMAQWRDPKAREEEVPVDLGLLPGSSEKNEKSIREICQGPGEEWRTEEFQRLLQSIPQHSSRTPPMH